MEPAAYLAILVVGLLVGALLAGLLVKGGRGPSLAASEAELADFKARIEERDTWIAELRRQVEAERSLVNSVQQQITEAAAARSAFEQQALQLPRLEAQLAERDRLISSLQAESADLKARHASLLTRLDDAEKAQADRLRTLEDAQARLVAKDQAMAVLQAESSDLKSRHAAVLARLEEAEKTQIEKLKALEEAQARLAETFKGVAAEALASNNQNFLTLAETAFQKAQEAAKGDLDLRGQAISDVMKPLKEALERIEKSRVESFAGLSEQVKLLYEAQAKVEVETSKLANALRTPAVRGRWGEMQLRRVVEMAGMLNYCDFEEQVSVQTESGRLRPDMIIRLPNHREVVVDSKVSLAAYLDSLECADDAAREARLSEHAQQVRQHVVRLSAKSYWDQFDHAPDFVVAFLPGETFFSAALQKDPGLIEFGVESRVLLATPTTLIALLKAVAYGWRQEKLAENAQQISDLGKELYERLRVFAGHMDRVRSGIEKSVDAYNAAASSLESRVLVSARRFKELSAGQGDDIPDAGPIDKSPRALQAPELLALKAGSGGTLSFEE